MRIIKGFNSAIVVMATGAMLSSCHTRLPKKGEFQGVIEFDERELGFEVSGRILTVPVKRGANISAGEILATLDDTLERTARATSIDEAQAARAQASLLRAGTRQEDIMSMQAQVRAAQASESLVEKNLARAKPLFASGAISNAEIDSLEAKLRAATAERQAVEYRLSALMHGPRREEIKSAESRAAAATSAVKLEAERIGRHELRAPENGVALDVHFDPGEVITAGASLVTMADTKHPYVDIFIPQRKIAGIHLGSRMVIHTESTHAPFYGSVETIARQTEFTPRYLFSEQELPTLVIRVRVRIDDPDEQLHAGLPAFVDVRKQ